MSSIRYLGIGLLMFVFMGGCESTPTVTRTGDVKDIIIGDKLSAAEVSVNPGDEVRWINKRTAPVRIVFLDPVINEKLSCKNNLGGWMSRGDTARLATNETASACFREVGQFRYTVRMDSGLTTAKSMFQESSRLVERWATPLHKPVSKAVAGQVIELATRRTARAAVKSVHRQVPLRPRRRPQQQRPQSNGEFFLGLKL